METMTAFPVNSNGALDSLGIKMTNILHITSGDIAGDNLAKAGLPGEMFVWHDILYEEVAPIFWTESGVRYVG